MATHPSYVVFDPFLHLGDVDQRPPLVLARGAVWEGEVEAVSLAVANALDMELRAPHLDPELQVVDDPEDLADLDEYGGVGGFCVCRGDEWGEEWSGVAAAAVRGGSPQTAYFREMANEFGTRALVQVTTGNLGSYRLYDET